MTRNIYYKYTLFERSNLTPIRGKPTFETLHKIRNEIKENTKTVYSNIGGGAHGHIGLVPTEAKYAIIYPTTFVYLTHLGPLIIPDVPIAHANSNMRITHTKEVRLSVRWRDWNKFSSNKLLKPPMKRIWRISASGQWAQ